MMAIKTPTPARRGSVFDLFSVPSPSGNGSPAQKTAIDAGARPKSPSRHRSRSPGSSVEATPRGRALEPKKLNVQERSSSPVHSSRKMDKGKGVDRSGTQSNGIAQLPGAPFFPQVYSSFGPHASTALQPSSSVNVPRNGPIRAAPSAELEGLTPTATNHNGMLLDDEGWPFKPMTRSPRVNGQSLAEIAVSSDLVVGNIEATAETLSVVVESELGYLSKRFSAGGSIP